MSAPSGDPPRSPPSLQRLCDPHGRYLQVNYRTPTQFLLTFSGLVAIAVTGFLGYPADTRPSFSIDVYFRHPWPLFTWFSALMGLLVASVLRGKPLANKRHTALLVVVGSTFVAAAAYYYHTRISDFIAWVINFIQQLPLGGLRDLIHNPATYTVLNYVILAGLVVDMGFRWIRRLRGGALGAPTVAGPSSPLAQTGRGAAVVTKMQEVLAGDLVVRGTVAFGMAVLLRFVVNGPLTACNTDTISLSGSCAGDSPPLWLLDLLLALPVLSAGLILLATIAQNRGLNRPKGEDSDLEGAKEPTWLAQGWEVAGTVVDILLSPVRDSVLTLLRVIRINIGLALHTAYWSLLMFAGISGAGLLALVIQQSLQQHSDVIVELLQVGKGIGAALLLVVGVATSLAAYTGDRGVVRDVLRFLRLVGFVFLIVFCLFSLGLAAFNGLLLVFDGCVGASPSGNDFCGSMRSSPFRPGLLTGVSLALLLGFALTRNWRRRSGKLPAS